MSAVRVCVACVLMALAALDAAGAYDLRWLSTVYDYGTFCETDGKQHGTLAFVNEGPDAMAIRRVRTTCGCTDARFTTSVINRGDTGRIEFDYNPAGRPGRFMKHIKVYTGEDDRLTTLTIKGNVVGSSATLAKYYPVRRGLLRLSDSVLAAPQVVLGRKHPVFLSGIYLGADSVALAVVDVDGPLSVELSPRCLGYGDMFSATVMIDSEDQEPGEREFSFGIKAGEDVSPIKVRAVFDAEGSGVDGSRLSEGPSCEILPRVVDLGVVVDKDCKVELTIRNRGGKPLNISNIYCSRATLHLDRVPKPLAAGETMVLKGRMNLKELPDGPFRIQINIISDDALQAHRQVAVAGIKESKKGKNKKTK